MSDLVVAYLILRYRKTTFFLHLQKPRVMKLAQLLYGDHLLSLFHTL